MTQIKAWSVRYAVVFILFLSVIIGAGGITYMALSTRQDIQQEYDKLKEHLLAVKVQLKQSKRNESIAQAALSLEQASQQQNKAQINQLTDELVDLRKELLVYQTIMAPELVNTGLSVLNWQLRALDNQRYQFTFLLYQASTTKKLSQGRVSLTLHGEVNQQSAQLDLLILAGFPHAETDFKFHYFQLFEGVFKLPEGFVAKQVELEAVKPTLKWQKFELLTQTIPWQPVD